MAKASDIKGASTNKFDYNKETDTIVTSFTEPDLFIYSRPGFHSNILNGKFVRGGSSFKKHFTPPFDMEARAFGLAKHWGITGDEIMRLWKAKGKSTTEFGTGFHRILELDSLNEEWSADLVIEPMKLTRKNYMALLDLGEQVMNNSKSATENYARPTHKDICALMKAQPEEIREHAERVVEEFHHLNRKIGYATYEVIPEVYVTCEKYGMGGEIDRLILIDKEKKICRIGDYKFKDKDLDEKSSNNKMLNELEAAKASENDIIRIQLSFYAYCLEAAGWTVDGGDVFGRNGEWTHYPIDLIPFDEMDQLLQKYLN